MSWSDSATQASPIMKNLSMSTLAALALAGTANAQHWIQEIAEEANVMDLARLPSGDLVALTRSVPPSGVGLARVEVFAGTGFARGALHVTQGTPGTVSPRALIPLSE